MAFHCLVPHQALTLRVCFPWSQTVAYTKAASDLGEDQETGPGYTLPLPKATLASCGSSQPVSLHSPLL